MADLDGRVAIVTGAAGGIGAETVLALCEAGARVVATDINADGLKRVVDRADARGDQVASHVADITDEQAVRGLVDFAIDRFGRLDIIDNNAGATKRADTEAELLTIPVDRWNSTFAINAVGPMLLCKHGIPHLLRQGGGAIVNISSDQADTGDLINPAYGASKAALNSLTRHVATVFGPRGIRCNAIAAGLIGGEDGPVRMPEPILQVFRDATPLARVGTPRDIADMVVFLASDRSSFITGQVIPVDGGILIPVPVIGPLRRMNASTAQSAT